MVAIKLDLWISFSTKLPKNAALIPKKKIASENEGYIQAMWCGELDCELKLKEEADVTSRCIPFGKEPIGDKCVCCGREAKKLVFWGKAY